MSFPPEVYLIGAMKAGTTSLAYMLDQHPSIRVADPKEPDFFTANHGKGADWYRQCFADPESAICVDASTSYASAPVPGPFQFKVESDRLRGVPARIHGTRPDAKLIYLLREPVGRTYSAYNHNIRAGWEKRTFMQAISENSDYLSASDYLAQIQLYETFFKKDSMLILLFDDLVRAPEETAQRCFRFLGLTDNVPLQFERARNAGFLFTGIGSALQRIGLMDVLSTFTPQRLKNIAAPLVSKKIPPMTAEDKKFLQAYFGPKNRELAQVTGLQLDKWGS